jgi:hypothetical protein
VFVSKLAYNINVPVYTPQLRKALAAAGRELDAETLFRARHEIKYFLEREMPRIVEQAVARTSFDKK